MADHKAGDFPVLADQGPDGVVVRFGDTLTEPVNRAALGLYGALEGGAIPDVAEASSALASVYVRFGGDPASGRDALARLLREQDFYAAELPGGRKLWRIPAAFGGDEGPALADVAGTMGVAPDAAVRDFTATRLRVQAIGFAPGQPYLGTLGEAWNLPRLGDLVTRPASAIVVAIRQACLFTSTTPTGWQQIGLTAFRTFRPESDRPFALSPADEVAFFPVAAEELRNIRAADTTGDGGANVELIP